MSTKIVRVSLLNKKEDDLHNKVTSHGWGDQPLLCAKSILKVYEDLRKLMSVTRLMRFMSQYTNYWFKFNQLVDVGIRNLLGLKGNQIQRRHILQ